MSTYNNKELYSGDRVADEEKLLPVLLNGDYVGKHKKISYIDNKIYIENNIDSVNVRESDIKHELVYSTREYTLVGKIYKKIDNERQEGELRSLMSISGVISNIDKDISNMESLRPNRGKRDSETGLLLPITTCKYPIQEIVVGFNESMGSTEIDVDTVNKYLKYLKVMDSEIYKTIKFSGKGLVLYRICTQRGINYKVLNIDERGYDTITKTTIEDIYTNNDRYDNVDVNGTSIKIVGFNGVYKYDMDKIYETYHREIVKSTRNTKATLVDPYYHEMINARGDMIKLECGKGITMIPNNVRYITNKSISVVSDKTTGIVFGENVKDCSRRCIEYIGNQTVNSLKYFEVGCNKKAGVGLLKTLIKANNSYNINKIKVKYTRELSPEEYGILAFNGKLINNVDSENMNSIQEDFVLKAVNFVIKEEFKNFRLLRDVKSKKEFDMTCHDVQIYKKRIRRLSSKLDKLKQVWTERLRSSVSIETRKAIENRMDKMSNLMSSLENSL